ncbi:MAG: 30S ribosomal protein S1 [Selenomonadaceae bacterium]|nr:30S ribosomal protein S1 [Selenomonadaceae bacterium]
MGNWFDESESFKDIREHEVVEGTVIQVNRDEAYVDIGYKQEIAIPKKELAYPEPESAEDVVKAGDVIKVYIQSLGGENGGVLSKIKADNEVVWDELRSIKAHNEDPEVEDLQTVDAHINGVVKGGLTATVNGLRGFIPASQMELHFVKDLSSYVGQTVQALPIEIESHKRRLVLSRRQLLERERKIKQQEIFGTLHEGDIIKGTVKRLVDYGAFIDVGGVDGLAHISDLSWERVNHPSDVLKVGEELDVYVKNVDPETHRISLSVKQTQRDPWLDKAEGYREGDLIEGKIVKLAKFGAFMEIEPGFDGLIPMGELSDRRIENADEAVAVGDIVRVKVLRIDLKRKRISLSINRARREANNANVKRYQPKVETETETKPEVAVAVEEAAPVEE